MISSTWFSTLEIGYLLHKRIFGEKSPWKFSETFYVASHGVLWRRFLAKFCKSKTCYISILRRSDHFARIFNLWNVLVFMILRFQICENLTESRHGVLGRSFREKFSKIETCYISIWRCPDSFALIFRIWKSILTKLFNN